MEENIARHIDEDRPWAPLSCNLKRRAQGRHELLRFLYLEVMLCDGHGDIENVRLLKGIAAQDGGIDLPRDRDDGNRIHECCRDACHEVRRARTARCNADADLARSACIAVGSMCRILLVRDENLLDFLTIVESIVKRQDHTAWIPKDRIDALLHEALNHGHSTCHLFHNTLS